ncbi:hypothetical protein RFM41_29360 [Mesorhizobium sp. VK25A]|uniref:HEPN domain-containing protein n=1 Tax=Mesorhizobium vachelliae TaxID=3072309 RepID=A0ABU5A8A6_9HYPH|nr:MULTISPECIES: hypothetical protein [unclassified Mesorhizobium]MDX8532468.1 hypothetical protein [Mesorhizobium sp. VK25D]MDX8547886.1 hypothetical protein [Mesorhizobium sp. VK25A]
MMAQNYRATADALEDLFVIPPGSGHPRRFLYYQALEHFLRTFLHLNGHDLDSIERHRHRWGDMLDLCHGLKLPPDIEKYIRKSADNNALVSVRYAYEFDTDPGTGRKATRSTLPLEKAVFALERAVGAAIEAVGRPVYKRPDPKWKAAR